MAKQRETDGARAAKKPAAKSTAGAARKRAGSARASGRTTRASRAAISAGAIEDAIELAVRCHRGQTDKYHQPYILHVLGVAGRCRSIEEKIVAFLHDTVEDNHTTFDELRRMGFSERVIAAVEHLTRRKGESYDAFVDRIAPDPLARAVKLADLEDNMDVRRSNRPMKQKDAERLEKYRKAWQRLSALHSGSEEG